MPEKLNERMIRVIFSDKSQRKTLTRWCDKIGKWSTITVFSVIHLALDNWTKKTYYEPLRPLTERRTV